MFGFVFPTGQHKSIINKLKFDCIRNKHKKASKKHPLNPNKTAPMDHPGENTREDEEIIFLQCVTRNSPEFIHRIKK